MGNDRRPITPHEADILYDHGIHPEYPAIPESIAEQSFVIARHAGKVTGLVVGLDYLQHADTGTCYFLEQNIGTGLQTHKVCTYADLPVSTAEVYKDLLFASLSSIADHHNDSDSR